MLPTLPELLARLSGSGRTDRNLVLLTLAVLGAISKESAVDTTAIIAHLKVSVGKARVPTNVSDALRKAAPAADCVQSNKSGLRWYLTATGRTTLEKLVNISLTPTPTVADGYDYDLAIVCALHQPELVAVLDCFGGGAAWRPGPIAGQPHIYKVTETETLSGQTLRVIAGAPTYMGLTATAILATQMILLFRPRFIVMIGIAAGTKSAGRGYGDILVADPSVDYASGKVAYSNGEETFHPDPFPLPIDVRLRTLVQEDMRTRDGLEEVARTWGADTPQTPLNIHIGPVGAADQVVDSGKRIQEIQKNWRKLIGVEMETYALYRAAHEAPQPRPLYASFKAVCDFAESKGDGWQAYAAHCAAAYAHKFLLKNWGRFGF